MLSILIFTGILLGLFMPGFILAKLISKKDDFGAAYIISSVILFYLIFITGMAGIKITLSSVGLGLLLLNAALLLVYIHKKDRSPGLGVVKTSDEIVPAWMSKVAWSAVFLFVGLMLLRSSLFSIPPGDKFFRWYFLAYRILELGTFDFYPPMTAGDFEIYFYTDSFPPIVSFTYYWLYALYGRQEDILICIPVTIQFILIFFYGYKLSVSLCGLKSAGYFAMLILGTSVLLFYSVLISQETGLTALSLLAAAYYLSRNTMPNRCDIILASFSTVIGGLSRDYGGVFLICGLIILFWKRAQFRLVLFYIVLCVIMVSPWYIRTFAITGNPFYSNPLGSLFPVNPVVVGGNDTLREYSSLKNLVSSAGGIIPLLLGVLYAFGLPFVLGFVSMLCDMRRLGQYLVIASIFIMLWLYTVGIVPGGLYHSMRVLSPAMAVLSVCGACMLATFTYKYKKLLLPSVIILVFINAAAFFLDIFVPINPFHVKTSQWLAISTGVFGKEDKDNLEIFIKTCNLPERSRILTSDLNYQAALAIYKEYNTNNVRLVSICSPEVRFLFDKRTSFDEGARELRKLGINYVILPVEWDLGRHFFNKYDFFKKCRAKSKPVGENIVELPGSK